MVDSLVINYAPLHVVVHQERMLSQFQTADVTFTPNFILLPVLNDASYAVNQKIKIDVFVFF